MGPGHARGAEPAAQPHDDTRSEPNPAVLPQRNTDRPLSLDEQRLQVVALEALQAEVKAALGVARRELHAAMKNGESHTVWSPIRPDEAIGSLNRSKPRPRVEVTDPEAFDAWVAERYPEAVTVTRRATEEGLDFLADAAPELIEERREVADWAREAAKKAATARGAEVPPGVEVITGGAGRLSVRLTDQAAELVAELIAQRVIGTRGEPLREIEA